MPANYFEGPVAERYDKSHASMFDPAIVDPAVDFLASLAGNGAALELGIGTGRIALPLAARGIHVHGVELSEAMVQELRSKPGGEDIGVTIGDFSTTIVDQVFSLAYLVFNTINNLTSQEAQVACFENVARHLHPGGRFVIEVGVPSLRRLPYGERFRAYEVTDTYLGVDEFDVARQRLVSHHFNAVDGRFQKHSIPFRYVWPSELDLMARLAGMTFCERWSSWEREPFMSESTKHISVWQVPE
jgi:SAM-dependent methyltransferase